MHRTKSGRKDCRHLILHEVTVRTLPYHAIHQMRERRLLDYPAPISCILLTLFRPAMKGIVKNNFDLTTGTQCFFAEAITISGASYIHLLYIHHPQQLYLNKIPPEFMHLVIIVRRILFWAKSTPANASYARVIRELLDIIARRKGLISDNGCNQATQAPPPSTESPTTRL